MEIIIKMPVDLAVELEIEDVCAAVQGICRRASSVMGIVCHKRLDPAYESADYNPPTRRAVYGPGLLFETLEEALDDPTASAAYGWGPVEFMWAAPCCNPESLPEVQAAERLLFAQKTLLAIATPLRLWPRLIMRGSPDERESYIRSTSTLTDVEYRLGLLMQSYPVWLEAIRAAVPDVLDDELLRALSMVEATYWNVQQYAKEIGNHDHVHRTD
jgi:hypothetical protein